MRRIDRSLLLGALFVCALPSLAWAHAVVLPKASTAGAYERYSLRVPNEGNVPTTRVELRVPDGVRVTAFAEVAGWTIEVRTDSSGRIVGAVWTGALAPKRFAEFPFVAVNPKEPGALTWAVYQTYGEDDRVEWTGPEGSESPASVTTIAPRAAEPASGEAVAGDRVTGAPAWVAWTALVASLFALGLGLRRGAPAR